MSQNMGYMNQGYGGLEPPKKERLRLKITTEEKYT